MSQLYDRIFMGACAALKYNRKMLTEMYMYQTTPKIEYSEIENSEVSNEEFKRASWFHMSTRALQITLSENFISQRLRTVPMSGFKAKYRNDAWFLREMINPDLFKSITLYKLNGRGIRWKDQDQTDFLLNLNLLIRDDSMRPMTNENIATGDWMYSLGPDAWINIYFTNRGDSYIGIKSGLDIRSYENLEEACLELEEEPLPEVMEVLVKWRDAHKRNQLRILARILKTCFPEYAEKDVIVDPTKTMKNNNGSVTSEKQDADMNILLSTYPTVGIPVGFKTPTNFTIRGTTLPRGINLEGQSTEPDIHEILRPGTYECIMLDDFVMNNNREIIRLSNCSFSQKGQPYCIVRGPLDNLCVYSNDNEEANKIHRILPTQMNVLQESKSNEECEKQMKEMCITWEREHVECPLMLRSRYKEHLTENELLCNYTPVCSRVSCYNEDRNVYENKQEHPFGFNQQTPQG